MTPSEVHEAAALIGKIEGIKKEIKQLELSVENPLAITGEVKYNVTPTETMPLISSASFTIESEAVTDIISLIRTNLEKSVEAKIKRLVELGVEAPE